MKIEDINYTLPTSEIDEKDFDKEKWLKSHPIDYYKFIYLLLTMSDTATTRNIPCNVATEAIFEALYPVTRLYIPDILYKFYSLNDNCSLNNKKFNTLENKQIFMSCIKDFNDPFDGKAFFYNAEVLRHIERLAPHNGRIIDDFTAFYKGTALTANDTSCMPMWAHYANNHEGLCVAYDMTNPFNVALSGCTFPVQYTDERLDITSFMKKYANMVATEVDKQTLLGIKKVMINDLSLVYVSQYLCNIKHLTWNYEKEFRCTMGVKSKGMPFVDAMPKAIYVGIKCNTKNRQRLVSIAKELSIPIYQMKFNECTEAYVLETKRITE